MGASDPWRIRRAADGDAAAISRLITESTLRTIAPDCTEAGTAHLIAAMSTSAEAAHLRDGVVYCVAERDGQLVGVAAMRPPAHLFRLFVADAMQRQGLARALWSATREAFARLYGTGPVTVNAARRALPAYERFGFVAQGPERFHDGVPTTPMLWQPTGTERQAPDD